MANTIQLWIDLWTTNSAIVVDHDGKIEVIKNSDQLEFTPSVFWYNKWKNVQVWKKAYDQLFQFSDDESVKNYKAEVKRLMWTRETVHLGSPNQGLYLKHNIWREFTNFSSDCVIVVLASEHYDESDYIRDYQTFLKEIKND